MLLFVVTAIALTPNEMNGGDKLERLLSARQSQEAERIIFFIICL